MLSAAHPRVTTLALASVAPPLEPPSPALHSSRRRCCWPRSCPPRTCCAPSLGSEPFRRYWGLRPRPSHPGWLAPHRQRLHDAGQPGTPHRSHGVHVHLEISGPRGCVPRRYMPGTQRRVGCCSGCLAASCPAPPATDCRSCEASLAPPPPPTAIISPTGSGLRTMFTTGDDSANTQASNLCQPL